MVGHGGDLDDVGIHRRQPFVEREQIGGSLVKVVVADDPLRAAVARNGAGDVVLEIDVVGPLDDRGAEHHQPRLLRMCPVPPVGGPPAGDDRGAGAVLEQAVELHGALDVVDPLWNQQGLDLEAAPRHRGLQALVEHPLVQGMLVDHLDALDGLDDDVAVVHLHGAFLDDAADVRPLRFVPFPDGHGQLPRRLARRFHRTEGRRRDGERLTGRLHLQWPPLHGLRRPEPRRQRGLRSRRSGRPQPGSHVAGEECRSQRREHEPVPPRRVAKPHLHLGRVHVHVDHVGGHLELEEHDRLPSG